MTDRIDDSDVRRVDQATDPTALNSDEIADDLPDDFSESAKQAFAERVEEQRSGVRDTVDLDKRIDQNPLTNQAMVRNESGQFAAAAENVEGTTLEQDGGYYAELSDGGRVRMDTVDLNDGAAERRTGEW